MAISFDTTHNPPQQLFEKYTIDKGYHISKQDEKGVMVPLSLTESEKLLNSNFFNGSLAFCRDTKHVGFFHKLQYCAQWIHAHLFGRARKFDPNLTHAVAILRKREHPKTKHKHSFIVAHAYKKGIVCSTRDYLSQKDVSELIIYKPIDKEVQDLYKECAEKNAYSNTEAKGSCFSPTKKASYSFWNMLTSLFHTKRQKKEHFPDEKNLRRTAYLVSDFLLQQQIQNKKGRPKSFFCSPYAAALLQGTVLLHSLRKHTLQEIVRFIQTDDGQTLDRETLARKIQECFRGKNKDDPISESLGSFYRQSAVTRLDTRYITTGYLAQALDELSRPPS